MDELGVRHPYEPLPPTPEFQALKSVRNVYDRNQLIRKLREQGFTLQAIADQLDITRERVRQICKMGG
jgi:DNA-directed RNA polymerase sigma subunit (sigma70/sigma32)